MNQQSARSAIERAIITHHETTSSVLACVGPRHQARPACRERRRHAVSRTQLRRRRSLGRPRLRVSGSVCSSSVSSSSTRTRAKTRRSGGRRFAPRRATCSRRPSVCPGFQLVPDDRGGLYRERLGNDEETAFVLNNGGGAKDQHRRPIRARVDYRIFNSEGKSPPQDRAADLRGTQSGVLKSVTYQQRAESGF